MTDYNINLIFRAALFAEAAHEGQFRKHTGGAYIEHPRRVAAQATLLGLSDEAVAAAFLHDVVEDCGVPLSAIDTQFGGRVAAIVDYLTDLQTSADGNRAERHKKFLEKTRSSKDPEIHTLKMLDITDNARSIIGYDPKFWHSAALMEANNALIHLDLADKRAFKALHRIVTGK